MDFENEGFTDITDTVKWEYGGCKWSAVVKTQDSGGNVHMTVYKDGDLWHHDDLDRVLFLLMEDGVETLRRCPTCCGTGREKEH